MHTNLKNEIIYFDERLYSNEYFHLSMIGKTLPNSKYIISHSPTGSNAWNKYNFEFVLDGKGYIEIKDNKFSVTKNHLFFLNKLQQHTYYADNKNPYTKLFIVVEGAIVDKLLELHKVTESAIVVKRPEAQPLFEQAITLLNTTDKLSEASYTELSSIVLKLIQMIKPANYKPVTLESHPAKTIKEYIDYNIYEHLSLEDIAKVVHLSISQASRLFRVRYGLPPIKYMLNKKLETAAHLFRTSFFNVTETSKRLAFSDEKYFSRLFKAYYGISPSQYIKRVQDDPFGDPVEKKG